MNSAQRPVLASSTEFQISLAAADDEPEIRALVGSVTMPGAVAVRFAREPDYFLGTTVMGDPCQVLIARHRPSGALAGIACRAERSAFVNGVETRIGYLGQIRITPQFTGRGLVRLGAQAVAALSPPGMLHVGVIARENPHARDALIGAGSALGLRAIRVSGLTSCSILLHPRFRRRLRLATGVAVTPASSFAGLSPVVQFLRTQGALRQFYPAYTLEDFRNGTLRGLTPADVLVARRKGAIVGVLAAWDQWSYKQDVVDSYGPMLRLIRPGYDLAARVFGAARLTRPGEAIPLSFAALFGVAGDDPDVTRALVAAATTRAFDQGKAFLMLGLADSDPLLPVVRRWPHITYRSDLYALSWSADPAAALDGRLPYLEIATL